MSRSQLRHVLESGGGFLEQKGIEHPRLACELLAARLLKCPRLELYLNYERELPERYLDAMRRGVKRLAAGEPVQYVLGEWDFMGHTFKVDSRALIPRPETQQLVQRVLDCEALWSADTPPMVVDVGTGSGCIVISLALDRPVGGYIGIDVSDDALALARENAERHDVSERIRLERAELCDLAEPGTLDAIIANLPYIPSAEVDVLPSIVGAHEPRLALDGGADGLDVVRMIVHDAVMALRTGGYLFLEIGETQGAALIGLLSGIGFSDVKVHRDLAGRDRMVEAVLSEAV